MEKSLWSYEYLKTIKYEDIHWKQERVRKIREEQSFLKVEKRKGESERKGGRKGEERKKEAVIPNTKCQPTQSISFEDTSVSLRKWKAKGVLQRKWPLTWSYESNFRGTEEALVLIMPQQLQGSSRNKLPLEPRAQAYTTGAQWVYESSHSTLVIHTALVTNPINASPLLERFAPAGIYIIDS